MIESTKKLFKFLSLNIFVGPLCIYVYIYARDINLYIDWDPAFMWLRTLGEWLLKIGIASVVCYVLTYLVEVFITIFTNIRKTKKKDNDNA